MTGQTELIRLADHIAEIRDLAGLICLAAAGLQMNHERNAMTTGVDVILDKLDALKDEAQELRGGSAE